MASQSLDDVDRAILYSLQDDARSHTTAEIAEEVGVSSSTVANRINDMEDRGIITGYDPTIDYEETDIRLHMQVTGTVPYDEQSAVAEELMSVSGVISVRELLTNSGNLSIELVGRDQARLEGTLGQLIDHDVTIERTAMFKRERRNPYNHFGEAHTTNGDG
jgi:DNA-binding Lrp family transcriptional regulator